jgi:hypothetical protein
LPETLEPELPGLPEPPAVPWLTKVPEPLIDFANTTTEPPPVPAEPPLPAEPGFAAPPPPGFAEPGFPVVPAEPDQNTRLFAPFCMTPEINVSMSRTSAIARFAPSASAATYAAFPSIRVITEPARTLVVCAVPVGIPIVPLFVNVPLTNILKPFVNNVTPAFTVRLA